MLMWLSFRCLCMRFCSHPKMGLREHKTECFRACFCTKPIEQWLLFPLLPATNNSQSSNGPYQDLCMVAPILTLHSACGVVARSPVWQDYHPLLKLHFLRVSDTAFPLCFCSSAHTLLLINRHRDRVLHVQ